MDSTIIYPNLKSAAGAVCESWCTQQGYSDRFLMQSLQWGKPPQRAASLF